jgi:hypothetical protein
MENRIWNTINAAAFFRDHLPEIKSFKHKIRGKNGRGNPCDFSDEEKKKIKLKLKEIFKLTNPNI